MASSTDKVRTVKTKGKKKKQDEDLNLTDSDSSSSANNEIETKLKTKKQAKKRSTPDNSSSFLNSKILNVILIITVAMLIKSYYFGETTKTDATIATDNIVTDDVLDEADSDILESVAVTTSADIALDLFAKLSDKFTSVKIKKTDLDAAERRLRGEIIENWDEKVEYDMTQGVPVENLFEFIDALKTALDLDDNACAMLKTMKFATENEKHIYEIKYEGDFQQKYGYLAMVKDPISNTISSVYAVHSLKFKLAKRKVKTEIKKTFMLIPIGTDVKVTEEEVKLGANDIEAIKATYMRYKALETLQKEGIIATINLIE